MPEPVKDETLGFPMLCVAIWLSLPVAVEPNEARLDISRPQDAPTLAGTLLSGGTSAVACAASPEDAKAVSVSIGVVSELSVASGEFSIGSMLVSANKSGCIQIGSGRLLYA